MPYRTAQECAIGASLALLAVVDGSASRLRGRSPFVLLATTAAIASVVADRRGIVGTGPSLVRVAVLLGALTCAAILARRARVRAELRHSLPVVLLALVFGISCLSGDLLSVLVGAADLRGATVERYLLQIFFPLASSTLGIALASLVLARSAGPSAGTQIFAVALGASLAVSVGLAAFGDGELALAASWALCLIPAAAILRSILKTGARPREAGEGDGR